MNAPALHITNWTAFAGKRKLFHVNNFQLMPGDFTALIGRNGAGKSTLLKTAAGLFSPPPHCFFLLGKDLASFADIEKAKTMASVFSTKQEIPRLQVKEVIAMGRYAHGDMTSDTTPLKIEHALRRLHIAHLAECWCNELSDGEWQKVTLARALVQEAKVLLLDEPTAFLDYVAKEEIMQLLRMLAEEEHLAILFTSHDLELAQRLAHSRWQIDQEKQSLVPLP
jgi:iron complex transport system ATP-binding protein